jgi:hypothetical protein
VLRIIAWFYSNIHLPVINVSYSLRLQLSRLLQLLDSHVVWALCFLYTSSSLSNPLMFIYLDICIPTRSYLFCLNFKAVDSDTELECNFLNVGLSLTEDPLWCPFVWTLDKQQGQISVYVFNLKIFGIVTLCPILDKCDFLECQAESNTGLVKGNIKVVNKFNFTAQSASTCSYFIYT